MNLTRTVHRAPIDAAFMHLAAATSEHSHNSGGGAAAGAPVAPRYDEEGAIQPLSDDEIALPLTAAVFAATLEACVPAAAPAAVPPAAAAARCA